MNDRYSRQTLVYGNSSLDRIRAMHVHIEVISSHGGGVVAYECAKNLLLSGVTSLSFGDGDGDGGGGGGECGRLWAICAALAPLHPHAELSARPAPVSSRATTVVIAGGDASVWHGVCLGVRAKCPGTWVAAGGVVAGAAQFAQDVGAVHTVHDVDGEPRTDMLVLDARRADDEDTTALVVDHPDDMLQEGDRMCLVDDGGTHEPSAVTVVAVSASQKSVRVRAAARAAPAITAGQYVRRMPRTRTVQPAPSAFRACQRRAAATGVPTDVPSYAMASYVGGVLAQEVLKCSGRFVPLSGAAVHDFELPAVSDLPELDGQDAAGQHTAGQHTAGQHTAGQHTAGQHTAGFVLGGGCADSTAGHGRSVFVVGAGALGCELLKGLVMLGFGRGGGRIVVTDMDAVALSNLSRQFLYRESDVGRLKAPTAAAAVRRMWPGVRVEAFTEAVGPDTVRPGRCFAEGFWRGVDLVVNALDNVQARKFVDEQCRWHKTPLFDSGTLGLKASVQPVLPDHTETYSDSRDPPTRSVPVCVLKQFPHRIEHCVQWALEAFADAAPEREARLKQCEAWFKTDIEALQRAHPRDALVQDGGGAPFWGGTRRYPTAVADPEGYAALADGGSHDGRAFDKDDDAHARWLWHATQMRARCYDIPLCTQLECRAVAGSIVPAVACTTSVAVALVCVEVSKWLRGLDASYFRSSYVNLADGNAPIVQSAPQPPVRRGGPTSMDAAMGCLCRTMHGEPLTCWDRLELSAADFPTYASVLKSLQLRYAVAVVGMSTPESGGIAFEDGDPDTHIALEGRTREGAQFRVDAETTCASSGALVCVDFPVVRMIA
jgi:tRNA A37 threonylcarbamoyladenosine dehydratase